MTTYGIIFSFRQEEVASKTPEAVILGCKIIRQKKAETHHCRVFYSDAIHIYSVNHRGEQKAILMMYFRKDELGLDFYRIRLFIFGQELEFYRLIALQFMREYCVRRMGNRISDEKYRNLN